jgi:hypothetical protein
MTLPKRYWDSAGREIFLSLKTPFKREAHNLAQYLHSEVTQMLNNPDTDLKELRRRLNELLQHRLAEDSVDL